MTRDSGTHDYQRISSIQRVCDICGHRQAWLPSKREWGPPKSVCDPHQGPRGQRRVQGDGGGAEPRLALEDA